MSLLIAGRGESTKKSFESRNTIVNFKIIVKAMRKILAVSGLGAVGEKNPPGMKWRQQKISATHDAARGYLGNHHYF
jgi:hypothetical protein